MNSRTTKSFWRLFDALPTDAQRQAVRTYALWRTDSRHPSLHFKCVNESHDAYSIRVGIHWRAIAYRDGDTMTWFWIGSHAGYDKLITR